MLTLILNGTNVVAGTNNSLYQYKFPGGAVDFTNKQVAVGSISLYYSWSNLTAANGNSTFSYVWPLPTPTTYTVTVPDGFYTIDDLNQYLHSYMVGLGQYLTDSSGDQLFYLELVTNSVQYAVQLNSYVIPTSSQASAAGLTAPSNWPGYATSVINPQFSILSNNFTNVVGLSAGLYPSSSSLGTSSQLSTFTPQVSPVQSVLVGISLCKNPLANPSNIIYSFSAAGVAFGETILSQPHALSFVDISNGYYNQFQLQFLDQNFNPLVIKDSNLVVMLLVKDKNE
jgi:hypothetical protein